MGDSGWWVAVVTGATALGASWITTRGNARSVRVEAEVTAHAGHVTEARNRRRDAYRELSAAAHALAEVFWRMEEVDHARTRTERARIIEDMQAASRHRLSDVTKASRDVFLEGPAGVAKAAAELRREAIAAHRLLLQLEDGTEDQRTPYDSAYRTFRDQHVRFLDLARTALEVR
ncbi:hypothetical protein G3I31_10425 [Streptomyces sp. SID9913]|uniref:hypothetical protein n=1 Tax=unclassified Streptomyces TaxID=2593676 RepID=UPI0013DB13A8|nr:hypothetical protein [Streptomyces sp. SID9913]NED18543.1 hypothetical protein [Streptomyces sp. SID9913]